MAADAARNAGRKPVIRWAIRMFRREWRQQVLVVVLLTVAVAASVTGSTSVVNSASDAKGRFGDANAIVRLDASDEAAVQTGIADVRARFNDVDVIAHTTVDVPGSVQKLDVRDQDPNGAFSRPMLSLRKGRYPTEVGQVALTEQAAELLVTSLGASLAIGDTDAVVVGIVENPHDLRDEFVLVAPGTMTAPSAYAMLVDFGGTGGVGPSALSSTPLGIERLGPNDAIYPLVLTAGTLAMALVGLIAASGFVVVAHRRQRQLGLLSAIGASDRHVRLVMVANGALVGIVAAIAGTVLGIGGWIVAAPAVESAANQRISRATLPWLLIIAFAVLSVITATAAAWWPARVASRLPVMTALSGRPSRPRPVHRSLAVAVVLIGAGVTSIAMSGARDEDVNPLLLIGGLLAVIIGTVFIAPTAIRLMGKMAAHLPFAPRLALRDLARYQARAAASLSAITLGLSIAVAIVVIASTSIPAADEGNLSSNELIIHPETMLRSQEIVARDPNASQGATRTEAETAELDRRAAAIAQAIGANVTAIPLDVAIAPATGDATAGRQPVALGRRIDSHSIELVTRGFVATPQLLALYGIDAASIDDATDVITSRDDQNDLMLLEMTGKPEMNAPDAVTQHVDLPSHSSAPNSLITAAAVQRHGWTTMRSAWIVETDRPLTHAQIKAARTAAADAGLEIEVRSQEDGLAALRTGATTVGALVALAIVAMALGLIRSESARDLATLTATGAPARTRRALTASTAAALALPGVVLGTAGAYIALIAAFRSDLTELVPVPARHLVALAIGLPLAASAAGWMLAGREPAAFARRRLD